MKKIISFSLYGSDSKYTHGALCNAEIAKEIFPDWICRFYIDDSCDKSLIETIKGENVEVVLVDSKDSFHGMFWRFYPASETDVDVMISRDCDSRLSIREKTAVDEWLNSDKDFHIMRDHPYHTTEILGGMWGCRNDILKDIETEMSDYNKEDFWQVDQNFLREKIYPLVVNQSIIHDSYLKYNTDSKKFPTERINKEFVGDVFDENDIRHPEYFKLI